MINILSATVLLGMYLLMIPASFYLISKYTRWIEVDHLGLRPFLFLFGALLWPYTLICIGFINMLGHLDALIIKIRDKK